MDSSGLWGNGAYTRYWAGRAVSQFGSALSIIAFPLLVLALGGSATQAGAVASCSLVTHTVLRLPAGHVADRVNQRTLMVSMDVVRFVAVGSIPLAAVAGWLSYPQLLVVAFVEGAATAAFGPASAVAFRDLVSKEQLTAALSRGQATMATVSMLGPVAGGALFGVDRALPFTVDAVSYLASTVLLLTIPNWSGRPEKRAGNGDRRVIAGVAWLWHQPVVMRVLLFCGLVNLVAAAAELAVLVGLRQHGDSGAVVGMVMACAGVGGIVGSLITERMMRALSAVALCTVTGLTWAAGSALFTSVASAWVIGAALVVMMLFAPAAGVLLGQITLGEAPGDILGRVTTAEQTVTVSLASVGPLLVGASLQGFGTASTWSILAGICVLSVLIVLTPVRSGRATPGASDASDAPDNVPGSAEPEPASDLAG